MRRDAARSAGPRLMPCTRGLAAQISSTLFTPSAVSRMQWMNRASCTPCLASSWASSWSTKCTSQGPVTLGIITVWSRSPISPTRRMTSSRNQGLTTLLTRVQSGVPSRSMSRASLIRPSRASTLRSASIASSRFPSTMSTFGASAGIFAAIFGLLGSKKWIIRDGVTGIVRGGRGAPSARGSKKARGVRRMFVSGFGGRARRARARAAGSIISAPAPRRRSRHSGC